MKVYKDTAICGQCTTVEYLKDFVHFSKLIDEWRAEKYYVELYNRIVKKYRKDCLCVEFSYLQSCYICEECIRKTLNGN